MGWGGGTNVPRRGRGLWRWLLRAGALLALAVAGIGSAPATSAGGVSFVAPRAGTRGDTVVVDDKPVFLIGSWGQCAADVDRNLALGINLFVTSLCDERALSDRIDGRAWMIQSITTDGTLPASIGFLQPDEPDVNGITAARLEPPRGNGKLTLLDVSMDFWDGSHREDVDYPALFKKGDVLSTNVYPIELNCNREPWVTLETPYDVQLQLSALGKPSGQWLEVNHLDGACGEHLTPAMVQAEAWLAVEGGASWIGWFLPEGDHGGYETFDVSAPIADTVRAVDAQLTSLAPVLLAPRLDVTTPWGNGEPTGPGSHPIKVGGRIVDGRYYLLATNSTTAPVDWARAFPGLAEKAVVRRESGGSGQLIAGKGGVVADAFGPLETRIYSWVPGATGGATATVPVAVAAPKPPATVAVELHGAAPTLRTGRLTAGKATLVVWNRTARGRTLALRGPGAGTRTLAVAPGAHASLTLTLVRGTYSVTDSLASGRALQLRVARRGAVSD